MVIPRQRPRIPQIMATIRPTISGAQADPQPVRRIGSRIGKAFAFDKEFFPVCHVERSRDISVFTLQIIRDFSTSLGMTRNRLSSRAKARDLASVREHLRDPSPSARLRMTALLVTALLQWRSMTADFYQNITRRSCERRSPRADSVAVAQSRLAPSPDPSPAVAPPKTSTRHNRAFELVPN